MGQYYSAYQKVLSTGEEKAWSLQSREYRKEKDISLYNDIKLMGHSYFGIDVTDAVCFSLYRNPCVIAWIGDYSDWESFCKYQTEGTGSMPCEAIEQEFADKMGIDVRKVDMHISASEFIDERKQQNKMHDFDIPNTHFDYAGRYAVNHSRKEAFFLPDCINPSDEWHIHPIPLLTAVGNGQGGGDFRPEKSIMQERVGSWAYDVISIEDRNDVPADFSFVEAPYFAE